MKYTPNQSLTKFMLFLITALVLCQLADCQNSLLYPQNGKDWSGVCNVGKYQSPINIIDGINTIDDSKLFNFI